MLKKWWPPRNKCLLLQRRCWRAGSSSQELLGAGDINGSKGGLCQPRWEKLFQREEQLFWRNLLWCPSVCAIRPRWILLNQFWSSHIFWWKKSSLKTNIFFIDDPMHFCLTWKKKKFIYIGEYLLFLINLFNFSALSEERNVKIQSAQMSTSVFSTFLSLASPCDFFCVIKYSASLTETHSSFEFFFRGKFRGFFFPDIPGKVNTPATLYDSCYRGVQSVIYVQKEVFLKPRCIFEAWIVILNKFPVCLSAFLLFLLLPFEITQ